MEFNDKQMKALEIYLKTKDKLLENPNYQLSPNEIQARFLVEHDEEIQKFLTSILPLFYKGLAPLKKAYTFNMISI